MEFLEFKVNETTTLIAKDAIKLVTVNCDGEDSKCTIIIGDEAVNFTGAEDDVMKFYKNFSNALGKSCKITTVEKEEKAPAFGNRLPNLDNCVLIVEENHHDIENS